MAARLGGSLRLRRGALGMCRQHRSHQLSYGVLLLVRRSLSAADLTAASSCAAKGGPMLRSTALFLYGCSPAFHVVSLLPVPYDWSLLTYG
jgi:hypothetical protein